jgi:hypothetical protein
MANKNRSGRPNVYMKRSRRPSSLSGGGFSMLLLKPMSSQCSPMGAMESTPLSLESPASATARAAISIQPLR